MKKLEKRNDPDRHALPRDIVPGFARLVKRTRKQNKWTQRELARRAAVSAMCVCDLEAEHRAPSLRVASAIAAALNLSVTLAAPSKVPETADA